MEDDVQGDVQRENLGLRSGTDVGSRRPSWSSGPALNVDALDPLALLTPHSHSWRVADQLPLPVLDGVPGYTPLQVQLLHNRGIDGADGARAWMERDWRASERLPGIDEAAQRIRRAIAERERIVVFGDFDADGITSCALLVLALRVLDADVSPYIPTREDAGRGPNIASIQELADAGTRLLITTDSGTTNVDEMAFARARGMEVIVTDHHAPEGALAADCILVNPHLAGPAHPDIGLAGVGVALRVAEALLADKRPETLESLLDLVALGTIADMAPISPANWALVRAGLHQLNRAQRPGIQALLTQIGLTAGALHGADIAYRIAPRLNAGQRMGEPRVALDLLLTDDRIQAESLAARLHALNGERQRLTDELVREARAQWSVQPDRDTSPVVIARGDGWRFGLLGLAAGRLSDEFHRPAVVVSREGDICRGSLRGRGGVSVVAALGAASELLEHFGGHERAAGFTVSAAKLDMLLASLRGSLARGEETGGAKGEVRQVDCQLPLNRVTHEYYERIRKLGPYGEGFAEPLFLAHGVRILRCFAAGPQRRHLRLILRDSSGQRVASWMGKGAYADALNHAAPNLPALDVVYGFDPFLRERPTRVLQCRGARARRPVA